MKIVGVRARLLVAAFSFIVLGSGLAHSTQDPGNTTEQKCLDEQGIYKMVAGLAKDAGLKAYTGPIVPGERHDATLAAIIDELGKTDLSGKVPNGVDDAVVTVWSDRSANLNLMVGGCSKLMIGMEAETFERFIGAVKERVDAKTDPTPAPAPRQHTSPSRDVVV